MSSKLSVTGHPKIELILQKLKDSRKFNNDEILLNPEIDEIIHLVEDLDANLYSLIYDGILANINVFVSNK